MTSTKKARFIDEAVTRRLIDRLQCHIDGRGRADADIGAAKIVIDRGSNADHRCAAGMQRQRTRLRAVSADDHERGDIVLLQRHHGLVASAVGLQRLIARGAEFRAAELNDAADIAPAHGPKVAISQSFVAIVHAHHFKPARHGAADDGAYGGIHAGRISPAG